MTEIEARYRARTPRSASMTGRAKSVMPGGSTRNFGYHPPYPVVIDRGEGNTVWDVDGCRYIDLAQNGLSLIHGHAFAPVTEALRSAAEKGTAWTGASLPQIEFAELLQRRLPLLELIRFTNSGTEAAMVAAKIARHATGRPLLLKAVGGYHGTYDDLEAGLHGRGELAGRTLLAEFGDAASFAEAFSRHPGQIAAVVIEAVKFSGVAEVPPPGFLQELRSMARAAGALFVLDDCLMFRLAVGGSSEKYHSSRTSWCSASFLEVACPWAPSVAART